jgi:putative protein-disulfide isomerase
MADDRPETEKRVLYFADPMCSWCWGFAPVFSEVVAACGTAVPVRVIVGGLRAGQTRAMSARAKAEVRAHWEEVRAATGQPFDFTFFAREGFVFDTEPACRAVVVVRNLAPGQGVSFLHALQRAFFAERRDVTDVDVLAGLAEHHGVAAGTFADAFASAQATQATQANFRLSQSMQIAGFPTILLRDEHGFSCLAAGYRPAAEVLPALAAWIGR